MGGTTTCCPPQQRYLPLCCALLIPFGAHVCYKMPSSIEKDLVESMSITKEQYGLLNAAVAWSSLLLFPVAAGYFMDIHPPRYAVLFLAAMATLGQLLFALAVRSRSFAWALLARFVFGIGEGAMNVAPGVICVHWFRGRGQMAMAIGMVEASHNLANFMGKVSISVGMVLGGWETTLWFGYILCFISLCAAVCYFFIERLSDSPEILSPRTPPQCKELGGVRRLRGLFWMFCLLHFFLSSAKHLFDAVSADFIYEKWAVEWTQATWLSALHYAVPLFLAPATGLLLDRTAHRMPVATFACVLLTMAHLVLGLTPLPPLIGLMMIALTETAMPTILSSSIPLVVPGDVSGVAFGVYSFVEKLGKVVGNPLVGRVRDRSGDYVADELIFAGMGACAVLCCVCIGAMDTEKLLRSNGASADDAEKENLGEEHDTAHDSNGAEEEPTPPLHIPEIA